MASFTAICMVNRRNEGTSTTTFLSRIVRATLVEPAIAFFLGRKEKTWETCEVVSCRGESAAIVAFQQGISSRTRRLTAQQSEGDDNRQSKSQAEAEQHHNGYFLSLDSLLQFH